VASAAVVVKSEAAAVEKPIAIAAVAPKTPVIPPFVTGRIPVCHERGVPARQE
jgi:hypothetical protein